MDMLLLVLLGFGALAGASLFGGSEEDDSTPGSIGSSSPGIGGYGPTGAHDLVWGTSGEDTLTGTDPNQEVFNAYAGDDVVDAGDGNDRVFAHKGDDLVNPGAGDDTVFGGEGNDAVDGGLVAGTFGDVDTFRDGLAARIAADANNEFTMTAGEISNAQSLGLADVADDFGADFLRGEAGNDILADGFGVNAFHGDEGADLIFATDVGDPAATPDNIFGGYGADTIFADAGDDVEGGEGVDHFVIASSFNSFDDTSEGFVTISDFDPLTEKLEIDDLNGERASSTITFNEQAAGTYVQVGGIDVVLLSGLTAANLVGADISVWV